MNAPLFLRLLADERAANTNAEPLNPTGSDRRAAIAFRIWQHCTACDWDCTIPEVAEALDLSINIVRGHCATRGWSKRMWTGQQDAPGHARHRPDQDHDNPLAALFDAAA